MSAFIILAEVFGFAALLCALHAFKPKLGLASLYLSVGLFEAFLFVVGKAEPPITASFLGVGAANVSYTLFLPLLLACIFLIYVMEGTTEARRLIAAVAIVYVIHGVLDVIIDFHASNPPPGEPYLGDIDLVWYSTKTRAASLVAIVADFVVLIVVYQALYNRLRGATLAVPFFAALVVAMVTDGLVFGLVRYQSFDLDRIMVLEKFQVGIAAAIPVAGYLAWRLSRHEGQARRGVLDRGALEIIYLQKRVREVEAKLKEQRAQYAYIKDTFSRYVSPEVVQAIIEDPTRLRLGGELRTVTVMFTDIRSYSRISEVLEPTEILELLNTYFRRASDVILSNKGMINEFEGDAVLAIFNAPLDLHQHALRAVQSGLELLRAVDELNDEWEADGTADRFREAGVDRFAVRVGIHTGPVVAGNVGSMARIKYTVIGDTVNTASRIETLNKSLDTNLLISHTTVEAISSDGVELPWEAKGQHKVKGRVEPVQVFTVDREALEKVQEEMRERAAASYAAASF